MPKTSSRLTYDNVFDAITSDPVEAAELRFKANTLLALRSHFEKQGWNRVEVGRRLEKNKAEVNALITGSLSLTVADLIDCWARLGVKMEVPEFGGQPAVEGRLDG